MLLILITISVRSKAIVVVNFGASDTVGCTVLTVNFHDSSSSNVVYRNWNFGNGNTSVGNALSPSTIYTTPGYYTVTLTVSDGIDTASITKTNYIHSLAKPVAAYTTQGVVSACAPFDFQVFDASTFTDAAISSWYWDFDDGTPGSTTQNVTHHYVGAGVFDVALIVTDTMGCTSSTVNTALVNVLPTPNANFTSYIPTSNCGTPFFYDIVNTSSGTTPLVFQWNIGASTYNTTDISDTLWQSGGYDVQLIATNNLGCSDTLLVPNYIWIGSIQASMNVPDTVCLNATVDFINSSNGGTTFSWNFGDGSVGSGSIETHVYNLQGTYNITLIAANGSACADTVVQTIYVENVQAAFSSTPSFSCEAPLMVNFTDQSIGNVVSWNWHFGSNLGYPNDTSDLQNPLYTFLYPGVFDDTLTVTSASGCTSTIIKPANNVIFVTQAYFIADSISGCAPLPVNFTNLSTPADSVDLVFWDYKDGSPIDTNYSPFHTFTSPGIYDVELSIVSVSGCTTLYIVSIAVGLQQSSNFVVDTLIACASDEITFTNLSSDTNVIDSYYWDFGDSIVSSDFEPSHNFVDTGYMNIMLVTFSNGCPDTLILDSAIQILGPLITYTPTLDCDTPNHYFFNPSTRGGTDFMWTFGDSTAQDSVNVAIDHYYPPYDANYTATFWAYDSTTGCSFTRNADIKVRYLVGVLTANDTNLCLGSVVDLNTYSSTNAISTVDWSLNDSTNFSPWITDISYNLTIKGENDVYAVVFDLNGCSDTLHQLLRVWKPEANFSAPITSGCAPLSIQFVDSSTSDTNIIKWAWNFGDVSYSNQQNPSHIYNGNGNTYYNVSLTVTDTFGCKHKMTKNQYIYAIKPPSYFEAIHRLSCDGDTVYFHSAPIGPYTYLWDFGDGTTSTLFQDQHPYGVGNYTISLTVTDALGCDSTYIRNNYVKVQAYPIANFYANPLSTYCYPSNITFTDSSSGQNIASWSWNFGDSPNWINSITSTVQNLYTAPGLYDVSMVVSTNYGCTDTLILPNIIDIGGPTADILIDPIIGCVNEELEFDADNTNVDAQIFIWDFGDGVLDTTDAFSTILYHTYPIPGIYSITLLYSDSLGLCQKTDQVDLEIVQVIADMKLSKLEGCMPLNVGLINLSIGGNMQLWNLDNLSITSLSNSMVTIPSPGVHTIQLIAWDSASTCSDTTSKMVEVFSLPFVKASPDKVVCIGDEAQLNATGADKYIWKPDTYLDYAIIPNPISTPTASIQYIVVGTDLNNCKNSDTVNLNVQYEPKILWFPSDTSIFKGGEFQVNVLPNMPLNYSWSPSIFVDCEDCRNPIIFPQTPTSFVLTYSDQNSCFTYDTTFYVNVEEEFSVYIPNAFTPNWNGNNDVFKPVTFGIKELVYMRVFDRWGKMVFETNDLTQGWDGRIDGEISSHNSVFNYVIQVRRYNDELVNYKGMVVLISE